MEKKREENPVSNVYRERIECEDRFEEAMSDINQDTYKSGLDQ